MQASTDQSAVDIDIPHQIVSFASALIQLLGIIAVMSQVEWLVFIVFIPVIAVSIWCQVLYYACADYGPNLFCRKFDFIK